jgi:hypothetical protein
LVSSSQYENASAGLHATELGIQQVFETSESRRSSLYILFQFLPGTSNTPRHAWTITELLNADASLGIQNENRNKDHCYADPFHNIGGCSMREIIGALIVLNGIVVGVYLLREKSVDWKGFLAVTAVSILAGVIVANLPYITQLVLSGGEGRGVTVNIQRQVEHVDTKAQEVETLTNEVRDMRGQIRLLVDNANMTNDKIQQSSKDVSGLVETAQQIKVNVDKSTRDIMQTSSTLQQMMTSYIDAAALDLSTRNIIPPPEPVQTEINKQLNVLLALAIPNPQERMRWVAQLQERIKQIRLPYDKK